MMEAFIDLLLNDSILFLIAITIIVLIILIICFIVLLKKKYDMTDNKTNYNYNDNDNVSKINSLINDNLKIQNEQVMVEKDENINNYFSKEEPKVNNKVDLEAMLLQMEESLNEKDKVIANFEQEQEEKAIISYEELKKAVNKNSNTSVTKVESLEPKINEVSIPVISTHKTKENRNFRNTDFISPIYGKMDNNYEYPTISEEDEKQSNNSNEIVFAKHSKDNNEVFLDSLKQFRKNLE